MKLLLLISAILVLSGCSQKKLEPCEPQPCIKIYPKLPTYKIPRSNPIPPIQQLKNSTCIIQTSSLLELASNNKKLRRICSNYAVINKRINKEYSK